MFENKDKHATALLLIGVLFWGMTFAFIKEAAAFIDAFSFVSVRFLIASGILSVIFYKKFKEYNSDVLKFGVLTGVILAAACVFQTIGLKYTTVSNAGFITALYVIFVLVFASLVNKRPLTLSSILATLIAFAGLILITVNQELAFNIGDLWVLACSVAFALHIIAVGRFTNRIDPILFSLTQFYTVAVITLLVGFSLNGGITVPLTFPVWQAILFCAIFATVYTYTAQVYFQRFLSEVKTAIICSFEPVFAAIFGFIYLSEAITLRVIIGGSMIFFAMILSELGVRPQTPAKSQRQTKRSTRKKTN